jgi:hypothetical protein
MIMKKYIAGLITGILVTLTITTFATPAIKEAYYNSEIKIVDKEKGQLNVTALTVVEEGQTAGKTYLPVADMSKALDKNVSWDGSTKTITLSEESVEPMPTSTPTPIPTAEPTSEIQYDSSTGLPVGAEYSNYELNGKVIKAVEYNGKTFLSIADLGKNFNMVSDIINAKDRISMIRIGKDSVTLQMQDGLNYLYLSDGAYYELSLVKQLTGE